MEDEPMEIQSIRTPGLGDTTYLIGHEGAGILVDPQRDLDRLLAGSAAGLEVRWILETHVHNDYLSGAPVAAARTGARLVLPAGAGAAFPHVAALHGEELRDGDLAIRPLHTPGHTPEHISYLLLVGGEPTAVFTGGSLLVGSAGRTDLLGRERARQLARLQHASVQRLAALPDEVSVYPTHGQGSFCTTTGGGGQAASTIGEEKRSSWVLGFSDTEAFADAMLEGLAPYPTYYVHMAPLNLRGAGPLPDVRVPELAASDVASLREAAAIVDLRPRAAFAAGHVPGSLGVELQDQFGTWVGWLLPFAVPVVLVADPGQDVDEAVTQLARIGFDDVRGVLRGLHSWRQEGHEVDSYRRVSVDEVTAAVRDAIGVQVLDVRSPSEWESERIPGSVHRYLPDLVSRPPEALRADAPVVLACASGFRASAAAGMLERHALEPVVLDGGGVEDVVTALRETVVA
jgi:hydroxyacylglutathione hydrolase